MATLIKLNHYEGEFNGVYQNIWVAISENHNIFKTSDLEFFHGKPDVKSTKWQHISNENFSQIEDEMKLKKTLIDNGKTKRSRKKGISR